jgi:hypothetical protein
MKRIAFLSLAFMFAACAEASTPEPTATVSGPTILVAEENPYAPEPGDTSLERAGLILTSIDLSEKTDLAPVRVGLNLLGSLPSICHELRMEVSPPNNQYQIFIEVYSVVNLNLDCENVFQQFEADILFGVYSAGRYTVWINKGYIGDFIVY